MSWGCCSVGGKSSSGLQGKRPILVSARKGRQLSHRKILFLTKTQCSSAVEKFSSPDLGAQRDQTVWALAESVKLRLKQLSICETVTLQYYQVFRSS